MTHNQFYNMPRKDANKIISNGRYLDLSPNEWATLGRIQGKEYFQAGFDIGQDTPTYSEIFDMVYIDNFRKSYREHAGRYYDLVNDTKLAFKAILAKRLRQYYGKVVFTNIDGSFPHYHVKFKIKMDDNIAIVALTASIEGIEFTLLSGDIKEAVAYAIKLEYKELSKMLYIPYLTAYFNHGTLWEVTPDPNSENLIKVGNLID